MMMETEETLEISYDTLLKRLRRIEGQIRGVEKMINDKRDCVSIVTQLAAVRSGIEGIGALVLNNCIKLCLHKGPNATANADTLERAMSIWGRVRGGEGK
jgi:DNA-binding FrmR family transcriptional regulator